MTAACRALEIRSTRFNYPGNINSSVSVYADFCIFEENTCCIQKVGELTKRFPKVEGSCPAANVCVNVGIRESNFM